MVDEVLKSYKHLAIKMSREFNVKDDEIEDIIRTYYNLVGF